MYRKLHMFQPSQNQTLLLPTACESGSTDYMRQSRMAWTAVPLYMLEVLLVCKAEQTSRTSSTTVTCRGLDGRWVGPLQMSCHEIIICLLGIQQLGEYWMLSASEMSGSVKDSQYQAGMSRQPRPKNRSWSWLIFALWGFRNREQRRQV
jgi:hypothetical protein